MISNQFRLEPDPHKLFRHQGQFYALTALAEFLDKLLSEDEG